MTHRRVGYVFARLHRSMVSLLKDDLEAIGIQRGQMPFLIALLKASEPVTQDAISTELVIDKAVTARVLEQLENQGLAFRKVNPDNRRQKLVSATDKARSLETRLKEILQAASDIFTQGFTEEELDTALSLMNRMIENATKVKYDKCPR